MRVQITDSLVNFHVGCARQNGIMFTINYIIQ